MNHLFIYFCLGCLSLAFPVFALDGQIQIHDPSTIVRCDRRLREC